MRTNIRVIVRINRETWARGGYQNNGDKLPETMMLSAGLINDEDGEGLRCCLGFAMAVEGADDHELRGRGDPYDVARNWPRLDRSCLVYYEYEDYDGGTTENLCNTSWAGEAVRINDCEDYTEPQRERMLMEHCDDLDSPFVFEFYGPYMVGDPRRKEVSNDG